MSVQRAEMIVGDGIRLRAGRGRQIERGTLGLAEQRAGAIVAERRELLRLDAEV